jgi:ribonuclease P protein subunit RPR2
MRAEAAPFTVAEAARVQGVRHAVLYLAGASGPVAIARSAGAPAASAPPVVADSLATGAPAIDRRLFALPVAQRGQPPVAVLAVELEEAADEKELAAPLAELAELGGALLENERRLRETAAEARQDPLTGLRNRRAFLERLELLLEAGASAELAVVFCDLDGFKRVNDRHGYTVGDEVLREVARVLSAELRPGEELFRIGGDEFAAVVLGGRNVGDVVALRLAAALQMRRRGPDLPRLSSGIAVFPADGSSADALLGAAAGRLASTRRTDRPRLGPTPGSPSRRLRLLAVDDDAGLRLLLRTTFELADITVDEAATVEEARAAIARERPDVVVLDVSLPGASGLELARQLKSAAATATTPVVLLTGGDVSDAEAVAAGAEALVRKPFSPLDLLATVERVTGAAPASLAVAGARPGSAGDQLLLYAGDLRRLLQLERQQRRALESAYRETVSALAGALELRDTGTAAHSSRVQRYASALAAIAAPELLDDPSIEYGFLLHDIGKIGIPDRILQKPGPLTDEERRVMQTHAPLGAQMLEAIGRLRGEGLAVVRHHHERWDGGGYPDGLSGDVIPLGARIFAVADALDAITSDRPYRAAGPWERAVAEIRTEAGRQFDPAIVKAFERREDDLRRIRTQLRAA